MVETGSHSLGQKRGRDYYSVYRSLPRGYRTTSRAQKTITLINEKQKGRVSRDKMPKHKDNTCTVYLLPHKHPHEVRLIKRYCDF